MQTVAVFNTRGGSGKSAATVFLADFLSTLFSKRVLVVDLDPQQSASVALLGDERLIAGFKDGKSLPKLLERSLSEELKPDAVRGGVIERPRTNRSRKGTAYLAALNVLACEREDWHDLDDYLRDRPAGRRPATVTLLRGLLDRVRDDFDICLIDFPGHETGPMSQIGLRAADWWLFPCVPDRAGIRDLEGPGKAIRDAFKDHKRQIRGLGTLLSISQSATSSEYRQAYQTLAEAAERQHVPRLFSDKAKLLIWTGARNALDDTLWGDGTTLVQKYKDKPMFEAVRALCREVLQRMELPEDEVRIQFGLLDGFNGRMREFFVRASGRGRAQKETASAT
jgi:chromosome partitioning protein